MEKKFLPLLAGLVIVGGAIGWYVWSNDTTGDEDKVETSSQDNQEESNDDAVDAEGDEEKDDTASIANPASAYCVEQGGEPVFYETEKGTAGYCEFEDGRICEEWAWFNSTGTDCVAPDETLVDEEKNETDDQTATTPTESSQNYSQVINDLMDAVPGFDQITMQDANFLWVRLEGEDVVEKELWGKSIMAQEQDLDFILEVEDFFVDNGFAMDPYNAAAGTVSGLEGYTKANLACQVYKEGSDSLLVTVSCAELE